jgi:hypothetical protein
MSSVGEQYEDRLSEVEDDEPESDCPPAPVPNFKPGRNRAENFKWTERADQELVGLRSVSDRGIPSSFSKCGVFLGCSERTASRRHAELMKAEREMRRLGVTNRTATNWILHAKYEIRGRYGDADHEDSDFEELSGEEDVDQDELDDDEYDLIAPLPAPDRYFGTPRPADAGEIHNPIKANNKAARTARVYADRLQSRNSLMGSVHPSAAGVKDRLAQPGTAVKPAARRLDILPDEDEEMNRICKRLRLDDADVEEQPVLKRQRTVSQRPLSQRTLSQTATIAKPARDSRDAADVEEQPVFKRQRTLSQTATVEKPARGSQASTSAEAATPAETFKTPAPSTSGTRPPPP